MTPVPTTNATHDQAHANAASKKPLSPCPLAQVNSQALIPVMSASTIKIPIRKIWYESGIPGEKPPQFLAVNSS
jgi:hypothetical protein